MNIYDADAFGAWLTKVFNESHFKSWEAVAKRIGSTRSTLSRYAGAKVQSLTGKASQPSSELCIKLAEIFNEDPDRILQLGGHAPINKPQIPAELQARISAFLADIEASDRPEDQKKQIKAELMDAVGYVMFRHQQNKS